LVRILLACPRISIFDELAQTRRIEWHKRRLKAQRQSRVDEAVGRRVADLRSIDPAGQINGLPEERRAKSLTFNMKSPGQVSVLGGIGTSPGPGAILKLPYLVITTSAGGVEAVASDGRPS
jgi:hypothetical protein